jgi:succinate-semialdehyde dehydrogenase/glutarate-semialdehyde dehydrogenase
MRAVGRRVASRRVTEPCETTSLRTAHELTHGLQTGMLWINQPAAPWAEMPFGGVKDSGYGSEGGPEALEAYLNTKSVAVLNT